MHEAYQTFRRAEEVTQLIVVAYWTNDVNAITKANEQIKLALAKCLEQMLLRSQSISVL